MKRGLKITVWILGLLAILLLAGLVAIQSPAVQTYLGKQVIARLQKNMDATIRFNKISVRPTEALLLEDLVVLDNHPAVPGMDTLLYVNSLSVKFSLRGLLQGRGAYVSRLRLHGGGFNLVTEENNEINLTRVLGLKPSEEESQGFRWGNLLTARQVELKDLSFRMVDIPLAREYEERGIVTEEGVIDWNHLNVLLESATVNNLKIANNFITGEDAVLQIYEKETGLHFQEVSARRLRVGEGLVQLGKVHLDDGYSSIHLEHFDMEGRLDGYGDFVNKVVLDGVLEEGSLVDMGNTIRHFAAVESSFRGYPRGHVHGTVNNLFLDNIAVRDADNGVQVYVAGTIKDIMEVGNSRFEMNVKEINFDMEGLCGFVKAWAPETDLDLKKLADGERLRFAGTASGLLDNLQVKGTIDSDLGEILADVYLKNVISEKKDLNLGGSLTTHNLHLGRVLGSKDLGPLSMHANVDAVFRNAGGMDVELDTLRISRLQALGYDYSGISAHGTYVGESLQATLVSEDPNLKLHYQGRTDIGDRKDAQYRFQLNLEKANLTALHLDRRDKAAISLKVDSDILRADEDNLDGEVTVSGIRLESEDGVKPLGDILIKASQLNQEHRLTAQSDALQLEFQGSRHILHFVEDIKNLVLAEELPALVGEASLPWSGASYQVSAQVLKAQSLLSFLVPGLYIENKTALSLQVQEDGLLDALVTSGRLALGNRYIKDFRLNANNKGSAINATLSGGTLELGGRKLLNNNISLKADDNHLELGYAFNNQGDDKTYGDLKVKGDLTREEGQLAVKGQVLPSKFSFTSSEWELQSRQMEYKDGDILVDRLTATHGRQSLLIDGGLRKNRADTLNVSMDQFDLALLNSLTGGTPDLRGLATGRAVVVSPTQPAMGLLAGITFDSVYVAHRPMGTLRLVSNYDEQSKRFTATVRNLINGYSTLDASAFLVPDTKEVGALLIMDHLDMGYAQPFLASLFSQFQGSLNGLVSVSGTLDKLELGSERLRVEDGTLALDFTQVPYAVDGNLQLTNEGLQFRQLRLSDRQQGQGTVEGALLFNDFKNIGLDIHVKFQQMHAINMQQDPDVPFFGNIYGDGRVDITGNLDKVLLGIEATTRSGEIHIPLGSVSGDRSRELLTFTEAAEEEEDPYELMVKMNRSKVTKQESELDVLLRVHATPAAQVYIDVDSESSLVGTGQGTVDIESRSRTGLFTLNGDYTLHSGNFHFSAMNLVSRDFTIQDGSSVRFNGDVMNTDLNVNGLYVTKASLYNLTADESATSRRTVNCGISITGKLSNPELHFSIDIPDLNPAVQAQVEGAFNTEDKIQKQFIYLLVAGNFLPSEESGISVEGSDVLFSNVSSIMSGQLNNIFQKLNIPLDLGLNYKNTQAGNNIFDVAVSTQLFNNRVVVNGTVGNKEDITGMTTNQVAGDVDIEIKLNRTGSLRVSLFTHSADRLSAFLDNSQRHGAGIAYQMEFNTFRQLFRDLFSSRAQKEKRAQEEARMPVSNVTMTIDKSGKAHVQR